MPITLLLFDVDGVLLHPRGYKEALRKAVDHFAAEMGLPPVGITDAEIAAFEACGITNEWDSVPMCVGALLGPLLAERPDLIRPTVLETLAAIRTAMHEAGASIARPDLAALARDVRASTPDGRPPTEAIHSLLRARTIETAHPLLAQMLGNIYTPDSPTTFVFQHYVLGSERFEQTYGRPAAFEAQSTLAEYDRPLLTGETRARLLARVGQPGWGAAIFTARPSHPPADLPPAERDVFGYPPEGDLAAELLELNGKLPLISGGRVWWLARQYGRSPADYLKPSPVQALAAIGAAISGAEAAALHAAARFVGYGELGEPLARLRGQTVRVVVFEDSTGGIRATERAAELLRQAGLDVTFEAVGIAPEASKREALAAVAGHVVDDVNQALEPYLAG